MRMDIPNETTRRNLLGVLGAIAAAREALELLDAKAATLRADSGADSIAASICTESANALQAQIQQTLTSLDPTAWATREYVDEVVGARERPTAK